MSLLQVKEITQQFGDKILYEELSLQLNAGEHVGITGQNGVGKSTLIKILTGEILPDEGSVTWQKNIQVGYLDQYVKVKEDLTIYQFLEEAYQPLLAIEKQLTQLYEAYSTSLDDTLLVKAGQLQTQLDESEFYNRENVIKEMATGLGIMPLGLTTLLKNLSGGQRSKVILAKLLLEKPQVLLLDEPTNHLDQEHIVWLSRFLQDFPGAFLVISHDREFLNEIVTHVADIEFGKLTKYTGNLQQAQKQKELQKESYLREYAAQKKHIEKTEAYIRKYKAGSRSTMAKSREKQLAKIDRLTPPQDVPTPKFDFPYAPIVTSFALETEDLSIGYRQPLLPPLNLTVRFGEKVALAGFNGIGKSTLIKTLLAEIPKLAGSFHFPKNTTVNYFAQELTWAAPLQTPLQYLSEHFEKLNTKELRRQLAKAGLAAKLVDEPLKNLSGGEQTKVKLAQLTLISSNFLFLDEPTNHIDQEAKEQLAKALQKYPGTLILVCHESEFYEDWIDRVINVQAI
ncbi:ABC-F family ATP-binding cassette domain-containing protein [Enterococcus nangangensis]|uniref:ABC-F family ATP-binding cassette domain-containing protein n=1 Tax=Enterococcus nangangensis TaxID=2559926 RepID=UPI0010F679F5|nr:ABC-F family ATP-binding cassette domain-containing protein [Enterococcus nangangensis]